MKWVLLIVWMQAGEVHMEDYFFRYGVPCSQAAQGFMKNSEAVTDKQILVCRCFPVSITGA